MALSIEKVVQDTAGFVKALIEYLNLKNKELYSDSSGWKTGSKTIPGISKYKTVRVYFWSTTNGVLAERLNDTDESFQMRGASMMQGVSNNTQHTSGSVNLFCKGDSVEVYLETYMHHSGNSNHGGAATIGIVKIVGVEPLIPDALAEYIRGGYCIAQLGGGLHVKLAKVLTGYRQRLAEDFRWHTERQPENRGVADPVGKRDIKTNCKTCGNGLSFSGGIFKATSSVWAMLGHHKLSRFIQRIRLQRDSYKIYNGIHVQLQHTEQHSRCLGRNRQSIASDWGCYCA